MALVYIGLGSNLGDSVENVLSAIRLLGTVGSVVKQSKFYRTDPWGVTDQPSFINAVIQLQTDLNPRDLLSQAKDIERKVGRTPTYRWGPRVIDIDILTYDDIQLAEPDLVLPHPHMAERVFVMVPLAEIDDKFKATAELISESERKTAQPIDIPSQKT